MAGLPLQTTCNPDAPDEHLLWALVGMAGPTSQAPLILPVDIMRKWSEHLYRAGFRHHPELQEIKYVPPTIGDNWVVGAAGEWVDINTPLPPETTAPDLSNLTPAEKQVLLDRLMAEQNGSVDNG